MLSAYSIHLILNVVEMEVSRRLSYKGEARESNNLRKEMVSFWEHGFRRVWDWRYRFRDI